MGPNKARSSLLYRVLYSLIGSSQGSKLHRDPRIKHPVTLQASRVLIKRRRGGSVSRKYTRNGECAMRPRRVRINAGPPRLQKSVFCLADRVVSSFPPVCLGLLPILHLALAGFGGCSLELRLYLRMAILLRVVAVLQTVLIMGALTAVTAGRPTAAGDATDAAKIAALCSTARLDCAPGALHTLGSSPVDGVRRDSSIHTINDLQRDFFLESALVEGGHLTLDANLRDAAPKRAFLTASAARQLPPLTSSSALDLIRHFGVARHSDMATAIATAAYLCGSGALPGESMSCAASPEAMADFVAAELGSRVKVLSTSNVPASAPAAKAPVTITGVAKGTVAEGKKIVVCHAVSFPSAAYYCHRVTGTKVITATLKPAHAGDSDVIKAVGVCHMDTSLWLSTHPAFRALNIPRGDEACHMLIDSDLVFVPTTTTDARG